MVQVLPPHARVCQSARVPVSAAFASSQAASSLFRSPPCCPAPQRPCCHLRLSFLSDFPHPSPRCTPHFWRHLTAVTFVASTRPPPHGADPLPLRCVWVVPDRLPAGTFPGLFSTMPPRRQTQSGAVRSSRARTGMHYATGVCWERCGTSAHIFFLAGLSIASVFILVSHSIVSARLCSVSVLIHLPRYGRLVGSLAGCRGTCRRRCGRSVPTLRAGPGLAAPDCACLHHPPSYRPCSPPPRGSLPRSCPAPLQAVSYSSPQWRTTH